MSNRKLMLAHVMARALSRNERWWVSDERNLFWRFERATVGRVWNRLVRCLPAAEGSRHRCLRLPGLTVVHGFTELRDFENMRRYGDEIRKFFAPSLALLTLERAGDERVIGIHLRRCDYRTWKGGRYCYSDAVWARVQRQMSVLLEEVPHRFEIFSDETSTRSAEEDQARMSQCDYLIGPPSTFTTWASFMGKVPLLHLERADQTVRLEDFKMIW